MNVHLFKPLIPIAALQILLTCEAAEVSSRTELIIVIGNCSNPDNPALTGVMEDMKSAKSIAKAMDIVVQGECSHCRRKLFLTMCVHMGRFNVFSGHESDRIKRQLVSLQNHTIGLPGS